jgi:hypothetical protein
VDPKIDDIDRYVSNDQTKIADLSGVQNADLDQQPRLVNKAPVEVQRVSQHEIKRPF